MNQEQKKPNWLVIGLIVVVIFLFLRSQGNNPGPDPIDGNVAATVEKATNKYAELLSNDMQSLASEVGAGTIKSSKALQDRARQLTEKTREEAFMSVSQLDNKYIPMEITNENKVNVASYLMEKSKGHKQASK